MVSNQVISQGVGKLKSKSTRPPSISFQSGDFPRCGKVDYWSVLVSQLFSFQSGDFPRCGKELSGLDMARPLDSFPVSNQVISQGVGKVPSFARMIASQTFPIR